MVIITSFIYFLDCIWRLMWLNRASCKTLTRHLPSDRYYINWVGHGNMSTSLKPCQIYFVTDIPCLGADKRKPLGEPMMQCPPKSQASGKNHNFSKISLFIYTCWNGNSYNLPQKNWWLVMGRRLARKDKRLPWAPLRPPLQTCWEHTEQIELQYVRGMLQKVISFCRGSVLVHVTYIPLRQSHNCTNTCTRKKTLTVIGEISESWSYTHGETKHSKTMCRWFNGYAVHIRTVFGGMQFLIPAWDTRFSR